MVDRVHDDLMVLSLRPDGGPLTFVAGQYTVLGLGSWEDRLEGGPEETSAGNHDQHRLIRRAYSISCPILDESGQLVRAAGREQVEFFIALVPQVSSSPTLTPRLFLLKERDRLFLGRKCHGHYTLGQIKPHDTVIFMATGTGEAPHNAMLAELLIGEHQGPIISVVCVRYQADLAYLGTHRLLEREFPNYRYLTLTTREPINLDRTHPHYIGKRYIQDYFSSKDLEEDAGIEFDPRTTHAFLCGSPAMIGVPLHTHDKSQRYPQPTGMVELLENRGFIVDRPHEPGNIYFEKYW